MPEGPEVRYITEWLNENYKGKKLIDVKINSGRYSRFSSKGQNLPVGWDKLLSLLKNSNSKGLIIKKIDCHGKFIWWEFENQNITLWNTLGMSGWWNSDDECNSKDVKKNHNHVTFTFDKKSKLNFNDIRNFGTIKICTIDNLDKKINELGIDILKQYNFKTNKYISDNEYKISEELFINKLDKMVKRNPKKVIGEILLEQKLLAGVGNYIRSDILWLSKISPFRKIIELKPEEKNLIFKNSVLLASRSYKKLISKKLPKNLMVPNILSGEIFLVYNQEFDPNKKKVIREKIGSRSVFWVPNYQK